MKSNYENELKDGLHYARKVRRLHKTWEQSKTGYKYPEKGVAYKNFLLIYCYGKIEYYFKQLLFDYFTKLGMPQRCVNFGNSIKDKLPGSMTKSRLNDWIKKECSDQWFNEINRRCNDSSYRCVHNSRYTFNDVDLALTSLTNNRHKLAHGESLYAGSVEDIIQYFEKSIVWLYEIDDIINKIVLGRFLWVLL